LLSEKQINSISKALRELREMNQSIIEKQDQINELIFKLYEVDLQDITKEGG
jgi:hypothetical protein